VLVNNSRGLQQDTDRLGSRKCCYLPKLPGNLNQVPFRVAWLPKPGCLINQTYGEIDRLPPVITQKKYTSIIVLKRCLNVQGRNPLCEKEAVLVDETIRELTEREVRLADTS
jgi:hypothetical protein